MDIRKKDLKRLVSFAVVGALLFVKIRLSRAKASEILGKFKLFQIGGKIIMKELVKEFKMINDLMISTITYDDENHIKEIYHRCSTAIKHWVKAQDDSIDLTAVFEKSLKDHNFFKKALLDEEHAKYSLIVSLRDTYYAYEKHYIRVNLKA